MHLDEHIEGVDTKNGGGGSGGKHGASVGRERVATVIILFRVVMCGRAPRPRAFCALRP